MTQPMRPAHHDHVRPAVLPHGFRQWCPRCTRTTAHTAAATAAAQTAAIRGLAVKYTPSKPTLPPPPTRNPMPPPPCPATSPNSPPPPSHCFLHLLSSPPRPPPPPNPTVHADPERDAAPRHCGRGHLRLQRRLQRAVHPLPGLQGVGGMGGRRVGCVQVPCAEGTKGELGARGGDR